MRWLLATLINFYSVLFDGGPVYALSANREFVSIKYGVLVKRFLVVEHPYQVRGDLIWPTSNRCVTFLELIKYIPVLLLMQATRVLVPLSDFSHSSHLIDSLAEEFKHELVSYGRHLLLTIDRNCGGHSSNLLHLRDDLID